MIPSLSVTFISNTCGCHSLMTALACLLRPELAHRESLELPEDSEE